jgi:hypothetical protein
MILSEDTVSKILDAEDFSLRQKLALGLDFSDDWVRRLAQANKPNGPLTTVLAVHIIEEETKLDFEAILVDETKLRPALSK